MKTISAIIFAFLLITILHGQNDLELDTVYSMHNVDSIAQFPEGDYALFLYFHDNMKYPQQARDSSIQGTVYINFIVEKNGEITNVTLLRGIGYGCDEAALRAVKAMPRWIPAYKDSKPVRSTMVLPLKFIIQG